MSPFSKTLVLVLTAFCVSGARAGETALDPKPILACMQVTIGEIEEGIRIQRRERAEQSNRVDEIQKRIDSRSVVGDFFARVAGNDYYDLELANYFLGCYDSDIADLTFTLGLAQRHKADFESYLRGDSTGMSGAAKGALRETIEGTPFKIWYSISHSTRVMGYVPNQPCRDYLDAYFRAEESR